MILAYLSCVGAWSRRSRRAAAWLLERTVKGTYRAGDEGDPMDLERAVREETQVEMEAERARTMTLLAADGGRGIEEDWEKQEGDWKEEDE